MDLYYSYVSYFCQKDRELKDILDAHLKKVLELRCQYF